MDKLKSGWKTSEFWTTLVLQGVSLAVIVGMVNGTESATLTDSLTKMVTAIFTLAISGGTTLAYIISMLHTRGPSSVRVCALLDKQSRRRTEVALDYVGFSYQYRYRSGSIPIYKILDRGTWEPGSRAVGNEIWMRNCFVPSLVKIESIEQFHSTEWYLPDCENPNIFQFLPLQTDGQGFIFTAGAQGVLVTWPTKVAHVRALFEKPRGVDAVIHRLIHFLRPCFGQVKVRAQQVNIITFIARHEPANIRFGDL
jgi:hypothetical protein